MSSPKTLFEFNDYKSFVKSWISSLPKQGYGQFRKIAEHLGISSVAVSHIFNGPRDLSTEQALELSEHLGLSELESEYFIQLVGLERAGTHKLKERIRAKLRRIREQAHELDERLPHDHQLDESARAQFYSQWYYSGIRLLTSIDGFNRIDAIADHLQISPTRVRMVVDFLLRHGLCVEDSGKIRMGPKRTHLESSSPLVSRHHANWRLKGVQNNEELRPEELFYTGPMTLSLHTMANIREDLVKLLERTIAKVEPSAPEHLACLNIDWFLIKK
jgi:uncharacterized protein (TIGR02147 family)